MKRRDFIIGAGTAGVALTVPSSIGREGTAAVSPVPRPGGTTADTLFPFQDSEIKFSLEDMMGIIRDSDHEGWRLSTYPDPSDKNVGLIGAGFNLNTQEIVHGKGDAVDPYRYNDRVRKEPSAEALWEAAGLEKNKLDEIRERLAQNEKMFGRNRLAYRVRDILTSDITDEEARRLLYVSTRQAVHNAMAYSRDFKYMSDSQQLGLSQLVYQMGSRLEGFHNFLNSLNDDSFRGASPEATGKHWQAVQSDLIDSSWYRINSSRATKVIAMLDPQYDASPASAECRVKALAEKVLREKQQRGEGESTGRTMYARHNSPDDRGRG